MKKKAIVLISGGLDSATCLAMATHQGYACYTLSFDYGQKQRAELKASEQLAKQFNAIEHKTFKLPINEWGGSALTDRSLTIPDWQDNDEIPITYVPARNTVFFAIALSWAEAIGAYDIFSGITAVDYSHYPDCRPVYLEALQNLSRLATKTGVEDQAITFHAPLIYLSKAETIQLGSQLGVDFSQTITCYRADEQGRACGQCASCVLRARAFKSLGIADPTRYITK